MQNQKQQPNQNPPKKLLNEFKLIVGLGNIGKSYNHTRHNAGFIFVDFLAKSLNATWRSHEAFFADIAEVTISNQKVILAKPTTLMNLSGKAVSAIAKYYKIIPEQILIAHDDLDIVVGEWKLHQGKGPKVHNGITSITNSLSNPNYWRLRIGIHNPESEERQNNSGSDFVLNRFTASEEQLLNEAIFSILEQHLAS